MDIREPSKITEEKKSEQPIKEPVIRTMQKDIAALKKGGIPVAQAIPPEKLPVVSLPKKMKEPREKDKKEAIKARKKAEEKAKKEKEKIEKARKKSEEKAKSEVQKQAKEQKKTEEKARKQAEKLVRKKEKERLKALRRAEGKGPSKLVIVGLAVILVIGGIGGFFYWWNYIRTIPLIITHNECQDFQCVSVEGEGGDECQANEDCQPIEPIEPIVPESLIIVDETEIIELAMGQENLLLDSLKIVASKEQAVNTLKRILIKLVSETEKEYMDLNTFVLGLGINIPVSILRVAAEKEIDAGNYTLFFYSQPEGNRLGIVIDMGESLTLIQDLKTWEESIITDLKPILFQDVVPSAFTEEFQDNVYKDTAIRYINFPAPDLSIDYAIIDDKLVIITSRESMYSAIDALLGIDEADEAEEADEEIIPID